MGLGPSWSDEEEDENTHPNGTGVEIDEGFADVDRAVAEQEAQKAKESEQNGSVSRNDPTGGRGANGHITKKLERIGNWDDQSSNNTPDGKW